MGWQVVLHAAARKLGTFGGCHVLDHAILLLAPYLILLVDQLRLDLAELILDIRYMFIYLFSL